MSGISVVVCCYNSEEVLVSTLKSLANQKIDKGLCCELILVNNNSTDSTENLALTLWDDYKSPFPLKLVNESTPGLSFARETGIKNANFDIIIFCDDDNHLQVDYISRAYSIMESDPSIGILAGQGTAVSTKQIPNWFYTNYSMYACGVLDLNSGNITAKRNWVWGAGMVLRKTNYNKIIESGFYHLTTDRKGNNLDSGGDVEICLWHKIVGFKLWYDEDLMFNHFMPEKRLNKELAQRQFKAQKLSSDRLKPYLHYIKFLSAKRSSKTLIKAIIALLLWRWDDINLCKWTNLVLLSKETSIRKIHKSYMTFQGKR